MNLEESKIVLLDYVIQSLDNGSKDEDVRKELLACIKVAKTIKQPFEKKLYLVLLKDMVGEQVMLRELDNA